jgi:L-fuconolactonase
MTIIDSQIHAYEANTPKRPWHSVPNWPDHVTGDEMVAAMDKVIDRHPDTRFIIDHLAILQPRTPPAPPQPWADLPKVLDLAKRKNAVIKVSGACTLSREPYPFPDIWNPLARVFDAWGFDRCLWGTDWTRAYAVVNYEQAVEPFLKTDRLSDSERAMLMGGACAKAYRWSPKKG